MTPAHKYCFSQTIKGKGGVRMPDKKIENIVLEIFNLNFA